MQTIRRYVETKRKTSKRECHRCGDPRPEHSILGRWTCAICFLVARVHSREN